MQPNKQRYLTKFVFQHLNFSFSVSRMSSSPTHPTESYITLPVPMYYVSSFCQHGLFIVMCLCLKVSEPIMTLSSAYQVHIQSNIQKGVSSRNLSRT